MKTLLAAAVSLSLIAGSITPVYASDRDHDRRDWQNYHNDQGRDNHGRDDRHDAHRGSDHRDRERRDDRAHYDSRNYRPAYIQGRRDQFHYDAGRYVVPRGYVVRSWHRGDYLPRTYYSSRYVINDYRAYRLYAPPRGHYWVRVNHDVLLTAVATGAVVAVVSGLFH